MRERETLRRVRAGDAWKDKARSYSKDHYERVGRGRAQSEWAASGLDRFREKKYGIAPGEVERMVAEQGGVCAVCRKPFRRSKKFPDRLRTAVDHCHKTGAVRGILCIGCNAAIGRLGDTAEALIRAAEYLVAFEEKRKAGP